MRFDVWCSRKPYVDHIAPVWKALPEDMRGAFSVGELCEEWIRHHDIQVQPYDPSSPNPIIIASRAEFEYIKSRRIVFLEHGVGASYNKKSHLPLDYDIELILTTKAQEEAHRELYAGRVIVTGCPKLDALMAQPKRKKRSGKPVVAFSHHWNQGLYPETRSAWPWDRDAIEAIVAGGEYRVLGHKHPGDTREIEEWWASLGVEFVPRFDEVLKRADLYVADNTSTLYEFAATDRPVVVLSPPWYRRGVTHGGVRFWSHVPGIECALPDHLEACISEALVDTPARQKLRRAAVEAAYGITDGTATARVIEALTNMAERPLVLPAEEYVLGVEVLYGSKIYPSGSMVSRRLAKAMSEAGALQMAIP